VLGVRTGYDIDQVDALIQRIEATLGRGALEGTPVTADEIRMARFDAKLGGYNEVAVDYALDAFVVAVETRGREASQPPETPSRVAGEQRAVVVEGPSAPEVGPSAPEVGPSAPVVEGPAVPAVEGPAAGGTENPAVPVPVPAAVAREAETPEDQQEELLEEDDAPTLPGLAEAAGSESPDARPVTVALTEAWLETQAVRVERVLFRPGRLGAGYNEDEVDVFLDRIVATLRGATDHPLTAGQVRKATFSTVVFKSGYAVAQVDAFLAEIADVLDRRDALAGEQQHV
jgi:DivIVA domain-containing protein